MKKWLLLTLIIFASFCNLFPVSAESTRVDYTNIAVNKLSQMEIDCTVESWQYLDGSKKDSYILFVLSPSGYMIYDVEFEIFLEISDEAKSPYEMNIETGYYFGFGNYKIIPEELEYLLLNEAAQKKTIQERLDAEQLSSEKSLSSDVETISALLLTGDFTIPRYYYFENLHTNFPDNLRGSCGFVALSILLGYVDVYYDDSLVQPMFQNHTIITEPRGTNQDLHDHLIELLGWDPLTSDLKTTAYEIQLSAHRFIDENNAIIKYRYTISWGVIPSAQSIRNKIDNGIPCLLFGHYELPDWGNHVVVAYGYNSDMFIVHSGHKGSGDSRVYLSEYLLGSWMTMTYSTC